MFYFFREVAGKILRNPKALLDPSRCIGFIKKHLGTGDYQRWLKQNTLTENAMINMKAELEQMEYTPFVSAVVVGDGNITTECLRSQIYPSFEIITIVSNINTSESLSQAVREANGEYILLLKEGDILYPNTLYEFIAALNKEGNKQIDLAFSDHDLYNRGFKRHAPFFKPGWSPDLFLVNNYLSRACLFRKTAVLKSCNENVRDIDAIVYDLCLKISEKGQVIHCPGILFSLPNENSDLTVKEEKEIRSRALVRRGDNAVISENKYTVPAVIRNLVDEPLVSIIVPTCFKNDYINICLKSITEKSSYKNYEIIVLDNSLNGPEFGSEKLKAFNCRVVPIDLPFNWARFNNIGVKHAKGDVYIFLNDDTEIIVPDWLERLVSQAVRPEIGVAGPLLLFPNGTVQQAGIFIFEEGFGAAHCFVYKPENYSGYHNILHYQRNCIAVTGACQAIARDKFEKMGGFDESFQVVFNDVDLCLRLWEKGYLNIYLPEAAITHKELASRGRKLPEVEDAERFRERWDCLISRRDPYFNRYLSTEHCDFRIKNHN